MSCPMLYPTLSVALQDHPAFHETEGNQLQGSVMNKSPSYSIRPESSSTSWKITVDSADDLGANCDLGYEFFHLFENLLLTTSIERPDVLQFLFQKHESYLHAAGVTEILNFPRNDSAGNLTADSESKMMTPDDPHLEEEAGASDFAQAGFDLSWNKMEQLKPNGSPHLRPRSRTGKQDKSTPWGRIVTISHEGHPMGRAKSTEPKGDNIDVTNQRSEKKRKSGGGLARLDSIASVSSIMLKVPHELGRQDPMRRSLDPKSDFSLVAASMTASFIGNGPGVEKKNVESFLRTKDGKSIRVLPKLDHHFLTDRKQPLMSGNDVFKGLSRGSGGISSTGNLRVPARVIHKRPSVARLKALQRLKDASSSTPQIKEDSGNEDEGQVEGEKVEGETSKRELKKARSLK